MKILNLIGRMYRPFLKEMIIVLSLILVVQIISLAGPYIHGMALQAILSKSSSEVFWWALAGFLLFLFQQVSTYVREVIEIKRIDFDIPKHISQKTLETLFRFSIGQHINENSSLKQSVVGKGQAALNELAHLLLYQLIPMILEIILIVGALLFLNVKLGFAILCGIIVYAAATTYYNAKFWPRFKQYEEMDHQKSRQYAEIIRNTELIESYAQEKRISCEYEATQDRVFNFGKNIWFDFLKFVYPRNCIVGVTSFVVLILGARYIDQGLFTPGYFIVIMGWSSTALARLGTLGGLQRRLVYVYSSIHQYFALMTVSPDITIVENPIFKEDFYGTIDFERVSFVYPVRNYLPDKNSSKNENPKHVLRDVTFSIKEGEKVAFVGSSGAGKSTICHLILRAFDPHIGQIKICGEDLRLWDLSKYREKIGIVPQDVVLFDESLRYNLTFGLNGQAHKVSDDMLSEISEKTGLLEFFGGLEKGYDTIVGERGIKLSGGQRQRVGIARALIKNPRIMIFDEATSSLDSNNEATIRSAIDAVSEGKTTIIIAHRLSTIKNVDKIFMLENGKLVGEGKHEWMLRNCNEYRELIKHQMQVL